VITGAGVSAGIDMALILASKIAGQVIAQSLQLAIEYDPAPPFDSGSPEEAPHALVASLVLALLFSVASLRRENSAVLADSQQKLAELHPGVLAMEA
jgi:hypothetical protein